MIRLRALRPRNRGSVLVGTRVCTVFHNIQIGLWVYPTPCQIDAGTSSMVLEWSGREADHHDVSRLRMLRALPPLALHVHDMML
jgi:hypothetical protein